MHVNSDYKDMLSAFHDAGVEFLVVGAYAMGAHGNPRATGDIVFQVGLPPRRIDILTSITDVDFDEAWSDKISSTFDGISVSVLSKRHLIVNKRAIGRPKDLSDVAWLEQTDHWDSGNSGR